MKKNKTKSDIIKFEKAMIKNDKVIQGGLEFQSYYIVKAPAR